MSTATLSSHPSTGLRAYFSDVSRSAMAFASALFAAQERQYIVLTQEVAPGRSARSRFSDHSKLIAMANDYQHMHPNLAAELRNLAGRD